MKVLNENPFEDKNMKLLVEWYEDKEKVLQFENQTIATNNCIDNRRTRKPPFYQLS